MRTSIKAVKPDSGLTALYYTYLNIPSKIYSKRNKDLVRLAIPP